MTPTTLHTEDLGKLGATRQSWRPVSPRDLLAQIVARHPRARQAALLEKFTQQALERRDVLETIIEYWFANNLDSLKKMGARVTAKPPGPAVPQKPSSRDRIETIKATIRQRVAIEVKTALLTLMMPHGKTLADTTGDECQALSRMIGPWLAEIGDMVTAAGSDQTVGAVLSEDRLREIFSRHNP
jgi:hypothetical protein